MSKRTKEYRLTESGGNRYPSLEAAQAAILEPLSAILGAAIRKGLASGELVVAAGKVVIPV